MPKLTRTRSATKEDGIVALQKAQQFAEAARSELENERWDSAGLNAIHAGISAADAALIFAAGIRNATQDHSNVISLLESSVASFRGSPRTQLVGLLKMKNVVAYEQRLITRDEAVRLVKAADRFLAWAQKICDAVR
ncbi:MAG: HEPN domain-containing protein [Coriobacteriia bacterium]|nr:HEPN domain-containing protein [Coriobacteriia bacterium]